MTTTKTINQSHTWRFDGFRVQLLRMDKFNQEQPYRAYFSYRLYDDGVLIFSGKDFSPSPMWNYDSALTVGQFLGWMTLKPGDTDQEFFEKYTPLQIRWCQSRRADELASYAEELENKEALPELSCWNCYTVINTKADSTSCPVCSQDWREGQRKDMQRPYCQKCLVVQQDFDHGGECKWCHGKLINP